MSVFAGLADVFTGTLGQPATFTPTGGEPRSVSCIFVARAVDEFGVIQPQPAVHAREADAAGMTDGAVVTVASRNYFARSFRPDGRGMVTIILEAA